VEDSGTPCTDVVEWTQKERLIDQEAVPDEGSTEDRSLEQVQMGVLEQEREQKQQFTWRADDG